MLLRDNLNSNTSGIVIVTFNCTVFEILVLNITLRKRLQSYTISTSFYCQGILFHVKTKKKEKKLKNWL
jgi:hypothetical protein